MDRGAWEAIVHGVAKSQDTIKRLTHTRAGLQGWQSLKDGSLPDTCDFPKWRPLAERVTKYVLLR